MGTATAEVAGKIDRSDPRAQGRTDLLRNLVPSCITCNRSKGALTRIQFGSGQYISGVEPKQLIHPKKTLKNVRLDDVQKL